VKISTKTARTVLDPADRRRQLIQAATCVFAARGYRNASIADVIEAAGVARGTFYLYFKSKEAIFAAILEDVHARLVAALSEPLGATIVHDGHATLRADAHRWLRFFQAQRDAATILLKEATSIDPRFEPIIDALRGDALQHFARRFRDLQMRGLVRSSIPSEIVGHVLLGVFDQMLAAFVLRQGSDEDLDVLADHIADFIWNGVK
jgi:AcrR family transcriptional regulator